MLDGIERHPSRIYHVLMEEFAEKAVQEDSRRHRLYIALEITIQDP